MHHFTSVQKLPIPLHEAWEFFSTPTNLAKITPPEMDFVIHHDFDGRKAYPGQIINYTVRPLLGIPMQWTTEIAHVHAPNYFVDEQRFGPYSFWHHKHFFTETEYGVLMEDIVHYKIPLGVLGVLANQLFIKNKLRQIFEYRTKTLSTLFGTVE